MINRDMINTCWSNKHLLDHKKKMFIHSLRVKGAISVSPAQQQYLQSCYDLVIEKLFRLEPMSTDKEYAAGRAIAKAKKVKL